MSAELPSRPVPVDLGEKIEGLQGALEYDRVHRIRRNMVAVSLTASPGDSPDGQIDLALRDHSSLGSVGVLRDLCRRLCLEEAYLAAGSLQEDSVESLGREVGEREVSDDGWNGGGKWGSKTEAKGAAGTQCQREHVLEGTQCQRERVDFASDRCYHAPDALPSYPLARFPQRRQTLEENAEALINAIGATLAGVAEYRDLFELSLPIWPESASQTETPGCVNVRLIHYRGSGTTV